MALGSAANCSTSRGADGDATEEGPAVEEAIRTCKWPGNVRQLQNEMQRIAALCEGPEVKPKDLSDEARG